jgi:hypothetical protein
MPTEELGASAARKYDMEAWMPGRGKWGEVRLLSTLCNSQLIADHINIKLHRLPIPPPPYPISTKHRIRRPTPFRTYLKRYRSRYSTITSCPPRERGTVW